MDSVLAPPLMGQVVSTWNGGAGLWSDPLMWSGGVPNGTTAEVHVDGISGTDSVVTLATGITVGRLQINAGDRVEMTSTATTFIVASGGFGGDGDLGLNGTLVLPGSAGNNGASQTMDGTKTLNGTGSLRPGGPGKYPEVYGNTTNNATNTGTMMASGGGTLLFAQGSMNGAGGQIVADGAGSVVQFGDYQGFAMVGGDFSTVNGGVMKIGNSAAWKDLTSSGTTQVMGVLTMDGTVTNTGVMTVGPSGRIDAPNNPTYDIAQTVTLTGTPADPGEVVLDRADLASSIFGYRYSRWLIQHQTIRGYGSVGDDDSNPPQIMNRGTFQADQNGQVLRLRLKSLDNQAGGILRIQAGGTSWARLRIGELAMPGATLTGGGEVILGDLAGTECQSVCPFMQIHRNEEAFVVGNILPQRCGPGWAD